MSRQIKALESELGVSLFKRDKDGISLTPAAQDLFAEVSASFARCSAAVAAIKFEKNVETVTFACSESFANFWLMPRIGEFWARYPEIMINYLISDQVRDYRSAEVDLFVGPTTGMGPNEVAEHLFTDTIYPVCGVGFAELHRDKEGRITDLPLLHMDWTNPDWPRWAEFLRANGLSFNGLRGRRFSTYSILLKAAEGNQGLALGWGSFVIPLIDAGRLVRFSNLEMQDPIGFYLARNQRKLPSAATLQLAAWMTSEARRG